MSKFRECKPQKEDKKFRFEDQIVIEKLLETNKLTEKQKDALRRLLTTYNYMVD